MAVDAPPDALRLTGTVIRLVRLLDSRMSQVIGCELGLTEVMTLGLIDRGIDLGSTIARSLQIDPARVTRIVERLVAQGYVVRGEDSMDRRRCPLSLTPSGQTLLSLARAALGDAMNSILEQLPPADRASLVGGLQSVRPVLEHA